MKYWCAARECGTDFYKGMQSDPSGNCRYSIKVVSERMSEVRFLVSCTVVIADSIIPHTNTLYPGSSTFNP